MSKYTGSWFWSSFDNMNFGFKRSAKVNPIIRQCKNCGYKIGFIYHKPLICPMCHYFVYPDDKYEFREKLKKEIKKNEEN